MAILLNNAGYENEVWAHALTELLPDTPVYEFPNIPDATAIKYAVIWGHPHGDLANYPNLRAVLVLGAGTDHLDTDPALSDGRLPIVRLIDPDVNTDMAQYALYWTLHFHRGYTRYGEQQAKREWVRFKVARAQNWRVTVLGLGRIGEFIVQQISAVGYAAQAWNRSVREIDGVKVFNGNDTLSIALANTDVLVNCLPLNNDTRALINAEKLSQLPLGSYLINISRGAVVQEEALINALQNGQLAGAALDCFVEEPLAKASPLWSMHNVAITPHISGATYVRSAAPVLADNIKRMERGEAPYPIHNDAIWRP